MKKLISLLLTVTAAAVWAGGKPVGVWQGYTWNRVGELVRATVLNPQWSPDKPVEKLFKGQDFDSCSAVVYLHGGNVPLRFREWKKEQIAAAEKYVENGGLIVFVTNGALNPGGKTGPLEKLLGAKNWGEFTGKAEIRADDWKQCGQIPQVFEHMLSGKDKFAALKDLTTAKMLIGNQSGALVAENKLGRGRVLFINVRLTESLTPYVQPGGRHANAALEQYMPFARKIHAELMTASPALSKEKRELWDCRPLGPAPQKAEWKKPKEKPLVSHRKFEELPGAPIQLIVNGQPRGIIVTGRVGEKGAAETLNALLQKMSGTTLPFAAAKAVAENEGKWRWRGKIWDFKIEFAETAQIEIKAQGNTIIIGTPPGKAILGVQTFMREALGYLMLWPGQAGEIYQTAKTVSIKPFSLTDMPYFRQRTIRNGYMYAGQEWKAPDGTILKLSVSRDLLEKNHLSGFDPRIVAEKIKGKGSAWWSAHRLGGSIRSTGGGNFYHWRDRYGKTHPEYLALQFDGTRKQKTKDIRICKANPEVIKQTVKEARSMIDKKKGVECFSVSPCDGGYDIFCMCPRCRAWDPTGAPEGARRVFLGRNRPVFSYPRMTDRVLRFTCEIARELKKSHPKIKVKYLAYSSYLRPPEYYRDIPDNIMVTYVGLEYLNRQALERDRSFWDFWAGVSSELILRPNYLLSGAGLPMIYVHEMARDIQHCAATGMVASDFDSLTHHWATLGLNYYVLAELLWDPSQNVDSIIDEYCQKGFGPAADEIKAYFALCEKLTSVMADRKAENLKEIEDLTNAQRESLMDAFIHVFNEAELKKLAGFLDRAREKTAPGSPERERVEFINAGFRFTLNRVAFHKKYHATKNKKDLRAAAAEQNRIWRETFEKYPFAVNIPGLALSQFYAYWRQCGWKPEPLK
ncbi:MAG: DUF4838 domain-containing protein [Lentisphaeria bacterium]|nr:DUF4838 domain-containing protein [Lentisphaeria bacterium]